MNKYVKVQLRKLYQSKLCPLLLSFRMQVWFDNWKPTNVFYFVNRLSKKYF